jgi:hypothetical protein
MATACPFFSFFYMALRSVLPDTCRSIVMVIDVDLFTYLLHTHNSVFKSLGCKCTFSTLLGFCQSNL